jgi:hyaluronan synthase
VIDQQLIMGILHRGVDELAMPVASPRPVSLLQKVGNVLGCLISLPLYWLLTVHCRWPVTLDLILTIGLAELNRYINEGRRMAFHEDSSNDAEFVLREKGGANVEFRELDDVESVSSSASTTTPSPRLDCLAAIVGWREDPSLYQRALESYKSTQGCAFVLAGIDGDEADDMDMVRVFNYVREAPIHSHLP